MTNREIPGTGRQFLRYAAVGGGSNLLLYLGYLTLVDSGLGYKTSMTIAYCAGVAATFLFNRNWSFKDRGPLPGAFARYVVVYVAGYMANFLGLLVLVDMNRMPHQWVQAAMIVFVAMLIFFLQKYWVFNSHRLPQAVSEPETGTR